MKKEVGMWMDHRKAVLVALTDSGEEIERIESMVEKQLRRSGRSPLRGRFEAQQVPADDSRERRLTGQRNVYYDVIIQRIRDAEAVVILGPGEAKGELKKRMEREGRSPRVIRIETAERMTDRQVVARVREHFLAPSGQERSQRAGS